ncbi:MAG: diadenylate cyclase [Clostridia bacterium]|nr:diadenylate cyclase [Clostridia bacterium]
MEKFISFINENIIPIYKNIDAISVVVYILLFLSIFVLLEMLAKNNASKISVWLSFYVVIISMLTLLTDFDQNIYILLLCSFVICVVVMFSTEIKRSVWNTKTSKRVSIETANSVKMASNNVNKCINEIIKALQNMSKNDVGAILVLSNTKIPGSILDSGVKIESDISSALIESIFFPKTPLHDGAIIIQNDKIQAAGCFLPLSQESDLPKELGTRHRAGIGVTEVLNVTAIIVSEETGIISIARGGKIVRYADSEMLRQTLKEYYWQDLLVKGK